MIDKKDNVEQLLISLRRIARAVDLHSKHLQGKYGLTGPQMMLIKAILSAQGNMTSKQLSDALSLSQATITSIVDRLVKSGYVYREKSKRDRRHTYIKTTEKSAQVFAQSPSLLQEDFTQQFAALESWEQNQMLSSLQRVAKMMQEKTIDTLPLPLFDHSV